MIANQMMRDIGKKAAHTAAAALKARIFNNNRFAIAAAAAATQTSR